jgi:hypothetical protein
VRGTLERLVVGSEGVQGVIKVLAKEVVKVLLFDLETLMTQAIERSTGAHARGGDRALIAHAARRRDDLQRWKNEPHRFGSGEPLKHVLLALTDDPSAPVTPRWKSNHDQTFDSVAGMMAAHVFGKDTF